MQIKAYGPQVGFGLPKERVGLGVPPHGVCVLNAYKEGHLLKADRLQQDKLRDACLSCRE